MRREILRQLESILIHERGFRNVYTYASRDEIAAEVDRRMDKFPKRMEKRGIFMYVLTSVPFYLAFKHGLVRHSRLAEALARFPVPREGTK